MITMIRLVKIDHFNQLLLPFLRGEFLRSTPFATFKYTSTLLLTTVIVLYIPPHQVTSDGLSSSCLGVMSEKSLLNPVEVKTFFP